MENITTKNGTNHILHGGYRFRKDKNLTRGYTSWRCITRKCCGRLRVGVTGDVVVSSSEHNHKPDADQSEVKNVGDEIQPRELENLRNEVKSIVAEIEHRELENLRNEVKKVVAEIQHRDLEMLQQIIKSKDTTSDIVKHVDNSIAEADVKANLYSDGLRVDLDIDKSNIMSNKDDGDDDDPKSSTVDTAKESRTNVVPLDNELLRKRSLTPTPDVWKQIIDALKDYNNLQEFKDTEDGVKYNNSATKTNTTSGPKHKTNRKIRHMKNQCVWERY